MTAESNNDHAPFRRILTMRDETQASIRLISPQDFSLEQEFVAALSPDSSFNRLFSTRRPDDREIERWTNFDTSRQKALIATTRPGLDRQEAMLGVVRFVREETGTSAEFAIVIGDRWKRHGLGAGLMQEIMDLARADGVKELYGLTLLENLGMQELCRKFGFSARRPIGDPTVVRLSLSLAT